MEATIEASAIDTTLEDQVEANMRVLEQHQSKLQEHSSRLDSHEEKLDTQTLQPQPPQQVAPDGKLNINSFF